jgi:hypothetical protein
MREYADILQEDVSTSTCPTDWAKEGGSASKLVVDSFIIERLVKLYLWPRVEIRNTRKFLSPQSKAPRDRKATREKRANKDLEGWRVCKDSKATREKRANKDLLDQKVKTG